MLVSELLCGSRIQAVMKKTGCQPILGIVKAVGPDGLRIKATGKLGLEVFVFWSSISHFVIDDQTKEAQNG